MKMTPELCNTMGMGDCLGPKTHANWGPIDVVHVLSGVDTLYSLCEKFKAVQELSTTDHR
jgi:hypothetical protein